ncbi:SdpI/YhfL protein family protein [Candidatus Fervidibacteria bacterium JGI MDM2 SSWTFF-3-K9]
MLAIHAAILAVGLGWLNSPRPVILPAIGVLFMVIGSILPKLKRNWVAGFRLSWTLVDDEAWKVANKFGGYGFVVIGALFLLAPLLSPHLDLALLASVFVLILATSVQAYLIYRRSNVSTS